MVQQLDRYFTNFTKFLVGFCLVSMTMLILLAVFTRYVLNDPISWAEEVARHIMIWMTFMGLGLTMREGKQVAITIIQDLLPPSVKKIIKGIIWFLVVFFSVNVIFLGGQILYGVRNDVTPALGISMVYPYLAVPLGFVLLLIHIVFMLLERQQVEDKAV